jgi:hypothetical protein
VSTRRIPCHLAKEPPFPAGSPTPLGGDPSALVLTGRGGPGVPRDGDRTVLSRHNFRRTYHAALAKLADPTGELRPTAA